MKKSCHLKDVSCSGIFYETNLKKAVDSVMFTKKHCGGWKCASVVLLVGSMMVEQNSQWEPPVGHGSEWWP